MYARSHGDYIDRSLVSSRGSQQLDSRRHQGPPEIWRRSRCLTSAASLISERPWGETRQWRRTRRHSNCAMLFEMMCCHFWVCGWKIPMVRWFCSRLFSANGECVFVIVIREGLTPLIVSSTNWLTPNSRRLLKMQWIAIRCTRT